MADDSIVRGFLDWLPVFILIGLWVYLFWMFKTGRWRRVPKK